MVLSSYSKINLSLLVNSKQKSGLHNIQSYFCLINLKDKIKIKKIDGKSDKINFTGDISPTETNQLGTREQPIMGEFFDIFYEIINPPDEFEELQGYRTYQVKIRLKEPAGNVYALVSGGTISSEGAANVGSNRPGIIAPPAWQQPAPLGTNITPVPRGFIESQGIAAYDSWLTIVSDTVQSCMCGASFHSPPPQEALEHPTHHSKTS